MSKLQNFIFSKSKAIFNDEKKQIDYNIEIIEYNTYKYNQLITDTDILLVLIANSKIGIFLTKSEIQIFHTFINHINYFNDEKQNSKTCHIINIPNMINPIYNSYLLEFPKYANIQTIFWDINFKNLIRELDPYFPEETLLEETLLNKHDILLCKLCHIGYIMKENTNDSCIIHPGVYNGQFLKFSCCGKTNDSFGCKIGYHYSN